MKGALAALLALCAAANAADTTRVRGLLDRGLWNSRIQTLYDLGEGGRDALPLLLYASDDADWQVRLTAVHFMGKLGASAAAALGKIARVEPCPRVRVSALRWLTGMGAPGKAVLKDVLTPEDEREMESLPDRYGTERMGKPLVIDAPEGSMTSAFFDHGLDLRVCASSEYANHRGGGRPPLERAPAEAVADEPDSFEPLVTPPVRPPKSAAAPVPVRGVPETLPDAAPSEAVALIEPEVPGPLEKARARPDGALADPRGTPETLPPSGPGLNHEASAPGAADFVADAGTGKDNDPIPELIRRLAASEPRTRARAADELGKRGSAALPAVPALRRALLDGDRRVRASAVLALGGVAAKVPGVAAELRRALRDKNEDVRFSAVIALQRLK